MFHGRMSVRWFGAKGDGATDDTIPIQAALDVGLDNPGRRCGTVVYFPFGEYIITSPLDQTYRSDQHMVGDTYFNSIIRGVFDPTAGDPNAADRAMLEQLGGAYMHYSDLQFKGDLTHSPAVGTTTGRYDGVSTQGSLINFTRCYWTGTFSKACHYCVSSESNVLFECLIQPTGTGLCGLAASATNFLSVLLMHGVYNEVLGGHNPRLIETKMGGANLTRCIYLNDGELTVQGGYFYNNAGASGSIVECLDGGLVVMDKLNSVEGTHHAMLRYTYDTGTSVKGSRFWLYGQGPGGLTDYWVWADDNNIIDYGRIDGTAYGVKPVRIDEIRGGTLDLSRYNAAVVTHLINTALLTDIKLGFNDVLKDTAGTGECTVTGGDVSNPAERYRRTSVMVNDDSDVRVRTITASVNDWTPTNWDLSSIERISANSGTWDITGMGAPDGTSRSRKEFWFTGTGTLTFKHQSTSSTAVNRIITSTGGDLPFTTGELVIAWYDPTTARWRVSKAS
jgi:hypothetical protein